MKTDETYLARCQKIFLASARSRYKNYTWQESDISCIYEFLGVNRRIIDWTQLQTEI